MELKPPSGVRAAHSLGASRSAEATCGLLGDQGALAGKSARSDSPGRARSHWKPCDRDVERFSFVCTVGRSFGKPVSQMGVLRPGTGKLQSGSAGLDLRKATCGPVPRSHKPYKVAGPRDPRRILPAEGEPDDERYSNDGQNDGYERTSAPCRTPTYARVGAPAARR